MSDLTPARVAKYFASARVTRLRDGRAKAPSGVAKTRRVLRLALVWGEQNGLIDAAPIPQDEREEPKASRPATAKKLAKQAEPAKPAKSKKAITLEVSQPQPEAAAAQPASTETAN